MATRATPQLTRLASRWEELYPSAQCSGIVGDLAHKLGGGYHISREDQPKNNYSVVRPQDRPGNGPNWAAAAIDMTMNERDMKLCTSRLRNLFAAVGDPRRKYLNAFNGWLGSGDAQRWDIYAGTISWATADHKWHVHLEIRRLFVQSDAMVDAVLSALAGRSLAAMKGDDELSWQDDVIPIGYPETWKNSKNNKWQAANALGDTRDRAHRTLDLVNEILKRQNALTRSVEQLAKTTADLAARINELNRVQD
jgi:hypothetical protein